MAIRTPLLLVASIILLVVTATSTLAQSRLTRPVDPSQTAILRNNVHPLAQARWDAGAVDPDMDLPYLTLHFRPAPAQQAALERLLEEQRDPSSPNYRRWLTPEEFGDHFGLSDGDIASITGWLRSQ